MPLICINAYGITVSEVTEENTEEYSVLLNHMYLFVKISLFYVL